MRMLNAVRNACRAVVAAIPSVLYGWLCMVMIVSSIAFAGPPMEPVEPISCLDDPPPLDIDLDDPPSLDSDFSLTIIHETAYQIRLEWDEPLEGEPVPMVLEKRYANGEWFTKATLDAGVQRYREIPTAHQVEDTPDPHCYAYRVVAFPPDRDGEGLVSNLVEFTPTTLNVLIDKPVESTSHRNLKTHHAPEANDGNQLQDSRWHSRSTAQYESRGRDVPEAEWLQVDLGEVHTIDKCRIIWQRKYWGIDYQVQVSLDAEDWQTAYEITGSGARDFIHDFEFEAVDAHYVRFWGTKSTDVGLAQEENPDRAGERSFSIMEFECFEPGQDFEPGAFTSLATGSVTDTSTTRNRAPRAVDGHMTSFWHTNPDHGREWLTVDLDREVQVDQIKLFWHNRPDRYKLQVATKSGDWRTVGDESTLSSFTVNGQEVQQLQEVVFAKPRKARHIRVYTDEDAVPIQLPDVKPKPELLEIGFILQELLVFEKPLEPPDEEPPDKGPRDDSSGGLSR